MTEFPTLNHEQPTMQHAIVAILEYVRATAPHRDDEQLQYFLVVDEGDWVQILSIDAGTWPDFGDGGLQAITGLAHALQAAGAVVVERGIARHAGPRRRPPPRSDARVYVPAAPQRTR